jgi:hypothetical protein
MWYAVTFLVSFVSGGFLLYEYGKKAGAALRQGVANVQAATKDLAK